MKVSDKQEGLHYGKRGTVLTKQKEISRHLPIRSIRGAMLDELKKENKFEEHVMQMEDESLGTIIESKCNIHDGAPNGLAEALANLSPTEQELVQWLFIEGFTLAECAGRVGITVAGIKKRRERLLVKLRSEVV